MGESGITARLPGAFWADMDALSSNVWLTFGPPACTRMPDRGQGKAPAPKSRGRASLEEVNAPWMGDVSL